ncbi:MAG: carboxypeptidase-like regulatory domain-containing protein [Bacteroidota bacterium]
MRFASPLLLLVLVPLALAQPSADVPVERVILFTSGVGYFEHEGAIRGDADLTLRFEQSALDDVIKSLVVEDPRGRVSEVVYPSQAPLERRLQAFAVDFSNVGGIATLFQQMRGAVLEAETAQGTFRGSLVSVDGPTGGDDDPGTRVTLLTSTGLRTIPLASARRVEIVDPDLRAEVEGALAALAEGTSGERKPVTVRFRGGSNRTVRLGYVVEAPVWKTTYRLVLPERGEREGYLQGWAVVENPTESDWEKVNLELVSGRPISFEMDLYSPQYLQRPRVVLPDEAAGVVPRTYDAGTRSGGTVSARPNGERGTLRGEVRDAATGEPLPGANVRLEGTNRGAATDLDGRFTITNAPTSGDLTLVASFVGYGSVRRALNMASGWTLDIALEPEGGLDEVTVSAERPIIQRDAIGAPRTVSGEMDISRGVQSVAGLQAGVVSSDGAGRLNARGGRSGEVAYYIDGVRVEGSAALQPRAVDPGAGVQARAEAGQLGELFVYTLGEVSIPRRGSAMLPVVTDPVSAERLSVFTPGASGRHPLRGARLRNTTGKQLRGGPITVFDDGYAGDAILPDLPASGDRLVTFAVDQDVLVDPVEGEQSVGNVEVATVVRGVLTIRRQEVRTSAYRVENRGEVDKTVLIEHPRLPGGSLTEGLEAEETVPGFYRLRVEVEAGEADTLCVREAAPVSETYRLGQLSASRILAIVRGAEGLSSDVRRALDRAADLAREVAGAETRLNQLEAQRAEIEREQSRIRENLQAVDSSTDYAQRLLRKLNEQEDRIESLDGDIDRARAELRSRRDALSRGVQQLNAE